MDLDNTDEIIKELEQNAKQLKSVVEMYQEIAQLESKLAESIERLDTNNATVIDLKGHLVETSIANTKQLDSTKVYIENGVQQLLSDSKKAFEDTGDGIAKIGQDNIILLGGVKESLDKGVQQLLSDSQKNLEETGEEVVKIARSNTVLLDEIKEFLRRKIEELYDDNKSFQKELDSSLMSRLSKQKSDILVEIRATGAASETAFKEALSTNQTLTEAKLENYQKNIEAKLKDNFEAQAKQIALVKIITFLTAAVVIGILAKLFI